MEYTRLTCTQHEPRHNEYQVNSFIDRYLKYFNIKYYESGAKRTHRLILQDDTIIESDAYLDDNLFLFAQKNNITDFKQAYALYLLSKD